MNIGNLDKGIYFMTQKDYILISNIFTTVNNLWLNAKNEWIKKDTTLNGIKDKKMIKNVKEKINNINKILASVNVIVEAFCHELKKDNLRFNEDKFKKACGYLDNLKINIQNKGQKKHYCHKTGAELKHCPECGKK